MEGWCIYVYKMIEYSYKILWEETLSVSPKYSILKSCHLFLPIKYQSVMQETVYSLCDKILTGPGDWSEMTTLVPSIAV